MEFRKYTHIERFGKEETQGILDEGFVYVQEKIDGANTVLWLKEDGTIGKGSRNQDITGGSFNGFNEYIESNEGIRKMVREFPEYYFYGEWLVKHSLQYNETSYKQWYMFDIYDTTKGKYLPIEVVCKFSLMFNVNSPRLFGKFECPFPAESIQEFVGKSILGPKGEGVVIKNYDFVNKFGDQVYAKIVTDSFKEENAVVFGGNSKYSEMYWEQYIVNKYMTLARVLKIMQKLQPQIDHKLDMADTPRISSTAVYDMISEESWEIFNKVPKVDNRALKRIATKKAIRTFHDILNNFDSVVYK